MTDGIHEGFGMPSEEGETFDKIPTLAQMRGRLVVVRGLKLVMVKNVNAGQPGQPPKVEKLKAEITFLEGGPIDVILDKYGQPKEQLNPPMQPGETRTGLVGGWFRTRQVEKMSNPGYPGQCGVLDMEPIGGGQSMWMLRDPSPEQSQQAAKWLTWKREQAAQRAAQNPMVGSVAGIAPSGQGNTSAPPVPQAAPPAPFPPQGQAAPAGATAAPPWAS